MVVSSIVERTTKNNGQLKSHRAMSLVMILSQQDPISQGCVISSITDLEVQRQIENHVTQVAHVIKWVLHQHKWNQLLNKKCNQSSTAIMRLSQVDTKIMCSVMLAA